MSRVLIIWLGCLAGLQSLTGAAEVQYFRIDPRTRNALARLPFFGGGVTQLLRYLRPREQVGMSRRSAVRMALDENYVSYNGAQLWKLNFNGTRRHAENTPEAQFNQFVEDFGSEVWNVNQDGIDILIEHKNVEAAQQYMEKTAFSYNIMIDDIETAIDDTYTEVSDADAMETSGGNYSLPWLNREGSLLSWRRYHDQGDIQQFLQTIMDTYPDLTEIIQIGLTRNKRPLEVLRVSNGNAKNWAVFVDAGMQARDWLSPAALTYAISKLTWHWGEGSADKAMRNIDWYFLPLANPDGYQYSRQTDRLWTKNRYYDNDSGCYGVNLDRNFDYAWGEAGSTASPCKNLYHGVNSFSEPETRALRNFLLGMREYLGAYVSFGGYGQTVTYPWGDADYVTSNQRELRHTARQAILNFRRLNHAEYSLGSSYRQKLARSGNAADWVQDRIEPQYVYNVFLKDQGRYGYLMPPHYILESGEEAYEFLRTIAQQLQ